MSKVKKNKQLPKHRSIVMLGMILSRRGDSMTNRNEKRSHEKDMFEDDKEYDDAEDEEIVVGRS